MRFSFRLRAFGFPHPCIRVLHQKAQWDKSAVKRPHKPRIGEGPVDEKLTPSLRTDKQWPPEACIVYPPSGEIKLSHQPLDLQQVIRGAMKAETKYVLWTNAFPPAESRMPLSREWLYAAAKERNARIIKRRVKEDDGFVRGLKDLVFFTSLVLLHDDHTDFCCRSLLA